MPDEYGVLHAENVEYCFQSCGMSCESHRPPPRGVASAVAQEVNDKDATACRDAIGQVSPEVRGSEAAMNENNRVCGAARAGGEAIDTGAIDIDELTTHGGAPG